MKVGIKEVDNLKLRRKNRAKGQDVVYEVLEAGNYLVGRVKAGKVPVDKSKTSEKENKLLQSKPKKEFKELQKLNKLIKEERKLKKETNDLIKKGRNQKAVEKCKKLISLMLLITMGKDLAARAFRKKLEKFLKEKKPKTEIKQIWLKLITPTKELYLEEITEKTKKEQKPQFLEKLEKSNEIKEKPKIEKKPDKSKAHKELKKISKHLTKKQEKEVKKWTETISEIQRIKEIKNYYRPLLTFLQKKYG